MAIESARLLNRRTRPGSARSLHPVRRRAHHDAQPAIRPELLPRPEPIWCDNDRRDLRGPDLAHPGTAFELLGDRVPVRFRNELLVCTIARLAERIVLLEEQVRRRAAARRKIPHRILSPLLAVDA